MASNNGFRQQIGGLNRKTSDGPGPGNSSTPGTEAQAGRTPAIKPADGGTQKANTPRPILVSLEAPDKPEGKKKGRPAGKKAQKAQAGEGTAVIINTLITGAFSIAAAKFGTHWNLSPEESNAITGPAANIIAKYMDSDKFEEHSDAAMLAISLGSALIPRVMITAGNSKKNKEGGKKDGNPGNPVIPNSSQFRPENAGSSRPDHRSNIREFTAGPKDVGISPVKAILEPISAGTY